MMDFSSTSDGQRQRQRQQHDLATFMSNVDPNLQRRFDNDVHDEDGDDDGMPGQNQNSGPVAASASTMYSASGSGGGAAAAAADLSSAHAYVYDDDDDNDDHNWGNGAKSGAAEARVTYVATGNLERGDSFFEMADQYGHENTTNDGGYGYNHDGDDGYYYDDNLGDSHDHRGYGDGQNNVVNDINNRTSDNFLPNGRMQEPMEAKSPTMRMINMYQGDDNNYYNNNSNNFSARRYQDDNDDDEYYHHQDHRSNQRQQQYHLNNDVKPAAQRPRPVNLPEPRAGIAPRVDEVTLRLRTLKEPILSNGQGRRRLGRRCLTIKQRSNRSPDKVVGVLVDAFDALEVGSRSQQGKSKKKKKKKNDDDVVVDDDDIHQEQSASPLSQELDPAVWIIIQCIHCKVYLKVPKYIIVVECPACRAFYPVASCVMSSSTAFSKEGGGDD
jgi:hypothetical protein